MLLFHCLSLTCQNTNINVIGLAAIWSVTKVKEGFSFVWFLIDGGTGEKVKEIVTVIPFHHLSRHFYKNKNINLKVSGSPKGS